LLIPSGILRETNASVTAGAWLLSLPGPWDGHRQVLKKCADVYGAI